MERRGLLVAGLVLLASLAVPWLIPRAGSPVFVWSFAARSRFAFDSLWPIAVGVAAAVALAAALLPGDAKPEPGRGRAVAVLVASSAALALFLAGDPGRPLQPGLVFGGWRAVACVPLFALAPGAMLAAGRGAGRAARGMALLGAGAGLAVLLAPTPGAPILAVAAGLGDTGRLVWHETAGLVLLLGLFALVLLAALALTSLRALLRAAGWLLGGWLPAFLLVTGLVPALEISPALLWRRPSLLLVLGEVLVLLRLAQVGAATWLR